MTFAPAGALVLPVLRLDAVRQVLLAQPGFIASGHEAVHVLWMHRFVVRCANEVKVFGCCSERLHDRSPGRAINPAFPLPARVSAGRLGSRGSGMRGTGSGLADPSTTHDDFRSIYAAFGYPPACIAHGDACGFCL